MFARLSRALEAAQKAVSLDPNSGKDADGSGVCLPDPGQYDRVKEGFRKGD